MSITHKISRIESLDLLRGIVMILMVLDHTRWFMHDEALIKNPEDLSTTTPILFFTRWITHFCAPVFIFLVGISARLFSFKNGVRKTTKFLFTRGLFLILLEFTIFRIAWNDGLFTNNQIDLKVIWAIGVSMVFLSLTIKYLGQKTILVIGLLIVLGHNIFDSVIIDNSTFLGKIWSILHVKETFYLTDNLSIFVLFPLLPYFGVVLVGYSFGALYSPSFGTEKRKIWINKIVLMGISLFIILRYFNLYGDPTDWSVQKTNLFSFLSFISTSKYPTSLLYLLMTIIPSLFILNYIKLTNNRFLKPIVIIGQAALFFYLIHLFVIKLLTILFGGFNTQNLIGVYLGWLLSSIILFYLSKLYRNYKRNNPNKWWLSYI